MDRKAFQRSVRQLRDSLTRMGNSFVPGAHKELDDIVHNVLGDEELENLDENLTQHIIQHIVTLKKAKEQEKLEAKAKNILGQIKAAIEEE